MLPPDSTLELPVRESHLLVPAADIGTHNRFEISLTVTYGREGGGVSEDPLHIFSSISSIFAVKVTYTIQSVAQIIPRQI